jgi:hypothetical protein
MRRQPEPRPAERLRELARAVERLAITGRLDPARIYEAKAEVAQQMRRLAAELEGRAA